MSTIEFNLNRMKAYLDSLNDKVTMTVKRLDQQINKCESEEDVFNSLNSWIRGILDTANVWRDQVDGIKRSSQIYLEKMEFTIIMLKGIPLDSSIRVNGCVTLLDVVTEEEIRSTYKSFKESLDKLEAQELLVQRQVSEFEKKREDIESDRLVTDFHVHRKHIDIIETDIRRLRDRYNIYTSPTPILLPTQREIEDHINSLQNFESDITDITNSISTTSQLIMKRVDSITQLISEIKKYNEDIEIANIHREHGELSRRVASIHHFAKKYGACLEEVRRRNLWGNVLEQQIDKLRGWFKEVVQRETDRRTKFFLQYCQDFPRFLFPGLEKSLPLPTIDVPPFDVELPKINTSYVLPTNSPVTAESAQIRNDIVKLKQENNRLKLQQHPFSPVNHDSEMQFFFIEPEAQKTSKSLRAPGSEIIQNKRYEELNLQLVMSKKQESKLQLELAQLISEREKLTQFHNSEVVKFSSNLKDLEEQHLETQRLYVNALKTIDQLNSEIKHLNLQVAKNSKIEDAVNQENVSKLSKENLTLQQEVVKLSAVNEKSSVLIKELEKKLVEANNQVSELSAQYSVKEKKLSETAEQLNQNTSQNLTNKIKLNEALDNVKRLTQENKVKEAKLLESEGLINSLKDECTQTQQKLQIANSRIVVLTSLLESKETETVALTQKYNQSTEQLQQQLQTIMNEQSQSLNLRQDSETQISQLKDKIKSLEENIAYRTHIFDTTKNSFITKSRELTGLKKEHAQVKDQISVLSQDSDRKNLELQKALQALQALNVEHNTQKQQWEQYFNFEISSMIRTQNLIPGALVCGKKLNNNQYRIIQNKDEPFPLIYQPDKSYTHPYIIGRIIFIESNGVVHLEVNDPLTLRFNA